MRDLKRIILHCSATPEGREVSVETIRGWHSDPPPQGRGWSDIGYHYVIHLDGKTEIGRPIEEIVKSLRLIFGELSIHGHNEFSTKACPSFSVEEKFGFLN
jgi:hypothetical protein